MFLFKKKKINKKKNPGEKHFNSVELKELKCTTKTDYTKQLHFHETILCKITKQCSEIYKKLKNAGEKYRMTFGELSEYYVTPYDNASDLRVTLKVFDKEQINLEKLSKKYRDIFKHLFKKLSNVPSPKNAISFSEESTGYCTYSCTVVSHGNDPSLLVSKEFISYSKSKESGNALLDYLETICSLIENHIEKSEGTETGIFQYCKYNDNKVKEKSNNEEKYNETLQLCLKNFKQQKDKLNKALENKHVVIPDKKNYNC